MVKNSVDLYKLPSIARVVRIRWLEVQVIVWDRAHI